MDLMSEKERGGASFATPSDGGAREREIRRRSEIMLNAQRNPHNKTRLPVKANILIRDDIPWLLSRVSELEGENEALHTALRVSGEKREALEGEVAKLGRLRKENEELRQEVWSYREHLIAETVEGGGELTTAEEVGARLRELSEEALREASEAESGLRGERRGERHAMEGREG
jgi:hypothetical protein